MGTNTGLGIGIGIPFKNNALGGDKPYFPPELEARMIGVWTNYGKKNTDTDRNIIKNEIPNAGGDLEILNAAYKLNSGFGEYSEDFTTWTKSSKITSVNSESFSFSSNVNWVLLYYKSNIGKDIPSFKVRIKLKGGGKVCYNYITSKGVFTNKVITSEEYVVPTSYNTKYTGETPVNCGFSIGITSEECSGTITQIPNFEDAFVTDGINDMIISQKTLQEMGVTKELTIVSMIHQIPFRNSASIPLTNYIRNGDTFIRNSISNIGKTGIYGYTCFNIKNVNSSASKVINNILGDKNDYIVEYRGDILSERFSVQGYIDDNGNILETSSVAHYWTFAVLGKATEDEINLIIGNYNLDRSLKPDILCNIGKQGITNDNHADFNDKLVDYSGNGRDIRMNNLAWKGGSGIAAKPFETIKDYTIVSDEARQKLTIYNEFSYKIKSNTPSYYWTVQSIIRDNTSYQVTIITDKNCYWINTTSFINSEGNKESIRKKYPVLANTPTQVIICGLDQFEYPEGIEPTNAVSYVNLEYAGEITVTFIPSHKGGLLLDGINDFGKVTGMPIYKDYTFIIDYERISYASSEKWVAGVVSKSHVANQGAFILMGANTEVEPAKQAYSFGGVTSFNRDDFTRALLYQSKYKCGNVDLTVGEEVDSDTLWLGTFRDNDQRFFNGAIYSLMSFPYSMSEFLIKRQLKKYKLGTLCPNMVEFRPIIESNIDILKINYWDKDWNVVNVGDYVSVGNAIKTNITVPNGYKVSKVTSDAFDNITIEKSSTDFIYDVKFYGIKKSPQKITMTIEQDENYVKFEPVITSNVEYVRLDFYLNDYQKKINIGDYIPKDTYLRANFYLKNNVDELTVFTFNGVNIGYKRSSVDDRAFNINYIYNYDSPQEVNITIDEYIRYEDIVQPYPVLLRFKDENGNEVSWGGKFKVGSTITRIGSIADPESNLLNGLYSISGLSLNGKAVTSSTSIVEKQMVFKTTATYLLDNNEPKCILSPRLLRIPNSSYKILGYIPDISGHGNHGVIHNSAYAEGSGVNEDGSYQFDGVDDFVTIPTIVGGKQVLMKVNWDSPNASILYDQRGYNNEFAIYNGSADSDGNPIPAYSGKNNGQTYIDGILNSNIKASELRAITHNITITNELSAGVNKFSPVIGSNRLHNDYFVNMALYDFMLFDEISTDDKIQELNKYIGIEAKVELPPYYWDTYGKTNSDSDRDTIQQRGIAVGDYDLTNYNHAYEGMSGYNGYPIILSGTNRTYQDKASYVNVVGDDKNVINLTRISFNTAAIFSYVKQNGELTSYNKYIESFKIKVTGIDYSRSVIKYSYISEANATAKTTMTIASDGIYELPKSFASDGSLTSSDIWIGINFTKQSNDMPDIIEDVNVTIEVLPEYENGLAYDGVEDYSKNANIPAFTDYTYIYKRTIINIPTNAATLLKGADKTNGGAFIADYGNKWQFNSGQYNTIQSIVDGINWQTVNSFNGTSINKGENIDDSGITVSKFSSGYASTVFYKLILYPKTISLLEINFLKNLMEKDEIIDLTNPIFIKDE